MIGGRSRQATDVAEAGEMPPMTTFSPRTASQSAETSLRRPQLRISERKLMLVVGDLAMLNLALAVALFLRWEDLKLADFSLTWLLLMSVLWVAIAPALECYDLRAAAGRWTGVLTALRAALVVIAVYLAIPYITPPLLVSRGLMLLFAAATLTLLALWRASYATLLSQPRFRTRALVIGAGWSGQTIVQAIMTHAASLYELVGFIDDDPSKLGSTVQDLPVAGASHNLAPIVREHGVQELILAITHTHGMCSALHKALLETFESGVRVTPMVDLYESITKRIAVEHIGERWYATLPNAQGGGVFYGLVKRAIDIFFGLVGTVAFVVVLPLAALAIKVDSAGPVFYRQERVGQRGRPLVLLKFRSMARDAEKDGEAVWAVDRDPRITRVGRILRTTHLDELPQFLSILKGDMSVIGPRPERPSFVAMLQEEIPFYRARMLAKPGLTGLAQVMYRYGSSVDDALVKLQYDLYCIKHQSLSLDLFIVLKTIGTVVVFRGT